MSSILPIITMTDLQRRAKEALAQVQDYAVIQSHGHDIALVLNPKLGRALLQSGALQQLLKQVADDQQSDSAVTTNDLDAVIGEVLRELSKK